MKNQIIRYLKDESGQTSTEYILLIAVVGGIIFKFGGILKEKMIDLANSVFDKAKQDLNSNQ